MSSQQLDEEAIFHIARKLDDPVDRENYLNHVCDGDQHLRERVEALLEVHEQEQAFLKSSPEASRTAKHTPITEASGQQIGRYKLLQKIGEGGFGVVYMAEQVRPVRRKVALKVIKPGMDTSAVVARFEAERQALALMDHPNIARVLDGGATDSGKPYFVMELVKGVPITEYCDKNLLSTRDRLGLFITVCQAVQHAHQKGIIHRDIKPSNILITLADGKPVVKVIDFGVSKALNQQLTEKTLFTAYGQMIGTPQYMSPEQAEMSSLDVDTRSDIFSLGVVLYELLTGTTPLESERLRTAGYAEMQRIIQEEESPKPSTRLSTLGEAIKSVAQRRNTDPRRLGQFVRGDMDWIVMKALDKDRSRRYESANGFANDVERFLTDEPVAARAPSTGYRFTKFIRRNKVAVITGSVFIVSILIGLTGFIWKAKKTTELAAQAKHLVIEKALLHAIGAEKDEVEATLTQYKSLIDEKMWSPTLLGAAHLHRGENQEAIDVLKPLADESPDNVAAIALLSIAYVHEGYLDDGMSTAKRVREMEPREEFRDLDLLFKGYALVYLDYELAANAIQEVIDRHPSWIVARAILAGALAHVAQERNSLEYIDRAVDEIRVVLSLVKDNALVTMGGIWVSQVAFDVYCAHGRPTDEIRQMGVTLADTLRVMYPDYSIGHTAAAQFYDTIGDDGAAKQTYLYLLNNTAGWKMNAIPYLYISSSSEEIIRAIQKLDSEDPWVSITKACILADMPQRRDEAIRIYKSFTKTHTSPYARFKAIQVLLLLGESDEARDDCRKWMKQLSHSGSQRYHHDSARGVVQAIQLIAESNSLDRFGQENEKLSDQCLKEYVLSLSALAKGNRNGALGHLETCEKLGNIGFCRYWMRAFKTHLTKDQDWPRANHAIHPDPAISQK
jgi:serine/threonine protein kinase/tetratricopeptide (TPR) repeat protein